MYRLPCKCTLFILALVVFLFFPSSIFSANLLTDDFSDGDSSNWVEHSPWGEWYVDGGEYIGNATLISQPEMSSYSYIGDKAMQNYIYNVDVKSTKGVDKVILFRINESNSAYFISVRSNFSGSGNDIVLGRQDPIGQASSSVLKIVPFPNFPDTWYHISTRVENVQNDVSITVYIDGVEYISFVDTSNPILNGAVGFEIWPGGYQMPIYGLVTETHFDNVVVTDFNTDTSILVPDLKQYDPLWKDEEYDHAASWAGNQKTTMERWGCLLTSLTMLGQYYGYSFSPQDLNQWLSSEPHAFTPRGALVIDMFGKYLAQLNLDLPKLEYKRVDYDPTALTAELEATHPAVLKWKGSMATNHFVIARGTSGDDFFVNDPATTNTLVSQLGPSIVSMDLFTPSHTDLSSIVLVVDEQYNIEVKDQEGNLVSVEESIEYPLHDVSNTTPQNTGERFVRIPKPQEGIYHVAISGAGIYTLHSYLFNQQGDEEYIALTGILANDSEYFTLTIGEESEIEKETTIESILADFDAAYKNGGIKSKAIYQLLKRELSLAQNFLKRNKTKQYTLALEVIKKQLIAFTPRQIKSDVSAVLQAEVDALLD